MGSLREFLLFMGYLCVIRYLISPAKFISIDTTVDREVVTMSDWSWTGTLPADFSIFMWCNVGIIPTSDMFKLTDGTPYMAVFRNNAQGNARIHKPAGSTFYGPASGVPLLAWWHFVAGVRLGFVFFAVTTRAPSQNPYSTADTYQLSSSATLVIPITNNSQYKVTVM